MVCFKELIRVWREHIIFKYKLLSTFSTNFQLIVDLFIYFSKENGKHVHGLDASAWFTLGIHLISNHKTIEMKIHYKYHNPTKLNTFPHPICINLISIIFLKINDSQITTQGKIRPMHIIFHFVQFIFQEPNGVNNIQFQHYMFLQWF